MSRAAYRREYYDKKLKSDPFYTRKRVRAHVEINLRNKYGITCEDWARRFEKQKGRCAGCKRPLAHDKNTHVDHCHSTCKFRGLLCSCCNQALGNVSDSVLVLESLIRYLKRTR